MELIDCPECNGTGGTGSEEKCERCRGSGDVLGRPPGSELADKYGECSGCKALGGDCYCGGGGPI